MAGYIGILTGVSRIKQRFYKEQARGPPACSTSNHAGNSGVRAFWGLEFWAVTFLNIRFLHDS